MAHVDFAEEGCFLLDLARGVGRGVEIGDGVAHFAENVADGTRPERTLAIEVFAAGKSPELDHSHSGGFLAAVVLLLHEEIELVEAVAGGAVFLFIIVQRLEKPDECDAALVFDLLHRVETVAFGNFLQS